MINGFIQANEWAQHMSIRAVRQQLEREYNVSLPTEYDAFLPMPQRLSISADEEEAKLAMRTVEMDKHLED